MACFKIEKDSIARFKNFASFEDAQTYADSLGVGFVVTLESNQDFPPYTRTLHDDMELAKALYDSFVQQNRDMEITPTESQELIAAIGGFKQLVDSGAIIELKLLILSLGGVDIARVYTAARQATDILKIESFIDSL
jgi:hypothetical protein